MASSSSSSSVVDLGEAADLDDATSRLFFTDISAAGPGLSWPAASEIKSTLSSQEQLVSLCSKHGVPSELAPVCADHLGWAACTPPPVGSNKLCIYAATLEAGLCFPLHEFYVRILRHCNLAPSQLTPNSWTYLAAFVLRCQDAGVEPLVSSFRYFFKLYAHTHEGKPSGWHHFRPAADATRRLFSTNLPGWSRWKSRFFFLDCSSGWKCPVKWGKPKKKEVRQVQLTDMVTEKLKHVGCVDINLFLANREMPVGDSADLAPLQSAVKAEAGAAGLSAAGPAATGVAAAAENGPTRKRIRLSPAAVLSQSQHLPTSAPAGFFAPIRASCTGGRTPPPGLAPTGASSTGGHNEHTPQQGFAPIRASSTGGSSGHIRPPGLAPIRASRTGGHNEHTPAAGLPPIRASTTGGSSGPSPQTMFVSEAFQLWEARAKVSEQAAMIVKLNQELQLVNTWNTQWQHDMKAAGAKHASEISELVKTWNTQWQQDMKAAGTRHASEISELITRLHAANDRNNLLISHLRAANVEIARLRAASDEVAKLHAAESAQLKVQLAAEAKQMKDELAEDAEQLKHEGYTMGARDMKDLVLTMYKGVINPDDLKVELLLDDSTQGASPVAAEDQ